MTLVMTYFNTNVKINTKDSNLPNQIKQNYFSWKSSNEKAFTGNSNLDFGTTTSRKDPVHYVKGK